MPNFFEFNGFRPVCSPSAFVHPAAQVIGDVIIGENVYIGPGCVLRGDWGKIVIADGCNVQENCVVHMFPGVTVTLEKDAHVGHGAVIHGASLGENCLVGMNAVIMDNARIGAGAIVGALAFVPAGMEVPPRKIAVGNPAKVIKDVDEEMLEWKSEGTRLYQTLPGLNRSTMRPCEPLPSEEPKRKQQARGYKPRK